MKPVKRVFLPMFCAVMLAGSGAALAHGYLASLDLLEKIRPGVTKAQEVRDLLGAPARTMRFPAQGIEAMEYEARSFGQRTLVSIAISSDGTVRDIQRLQQSGP